MITGLLKNKIAKNASWIVMCRIAQSVVSMLIAILTARYLGPSNYGVINYAASLTALFTPIMYLGFNSTLVQELVDAPEKEGEVMGTSIGLSIVSALMCMVGSLSFASIANAGERETIIVCVLYSTLLIFQAIDLLQFWFLSKYLSKISSIAMLVSYTVVALYKVFLLATGKSIIWFAISNSLEYMLIAVLLLIVYRSKGGARFSFSWTTGKKMLSKSKYYILANMMATIYANMGKIIIDLVMDSAAIGYYSAAFSLMTMSSFVFNAIVDSFRPEVLKQKEEKNIEKKMCWLFSIVFYLALIQCIVLCVFAKPIVTIIYGKSYFPAVSVLQVGVWYTIISYMSYARGIWVLAMGRQKYLWVLSLSSAVTNIVLNVLLIPQIGIIGAALASIATEFMGNVVVCYFIKPMRRSLVLMAKSVSPSILLSMIRKQL